MAIEIRNATRDEYTAVADAMSTAFLERPDVAAIGAQVQDLWEPERTWAAFDGDRICGTFRSWPTELTLPGLATLPAAAVAGVTVLPTHRRQGILTRLTAAEHDALVERGEALALPHPAPRCRHGLDGARHPDTGDRGRAEGPLRRLAVEPAGRDQAPELVVG